MRTILISCICVIAVISPPMRAQDTAASADRFGALEERIRALESQVAELKTALEASGSAPAPAVAAAPAAQVMPQTAPPPEPVLGGAGGMAKALNPDIGIIGNFVGATGRNNVNAYPSLSLQESEVSFQAIVDPYARADFFLAVGEEGIEGAGPSLSRILPAPIFLEATAELFRGDSGSLFHASRRSDVSNVFHLRSYGDLTESTNLEIGGSYARGHNDVGSDFITHLTGLDATLRWKPLRRAIYRSFSARSEFVWSRRQEDATTQRAFGFFASAEYQLARRWFTGARVDWAERARNASQHDSAESVVLTYWPSEFSQIRGQLRRTRYAEGQTANEFLFQFLFTMGAHGAHPF